MFVICPLSNCANEEKCDRVSDLLENIEVAYVLTSRVSRMHFGDISRDL